MKSRLIILLVVSGLLSSCDPLVNYAFRVENNSSHPLKVEYLVGITDTSFILPIGKEALLHNEERINKEATDYYLDSLWLFNNFNILQSDSIALNFEVKDRKKWGFEQKSKVEGEYRLRLTDPDFQ